MFGPFVSGGSAARCHAQQIRQAPSDHGRDPVLAPAANAFAVQTQRPRDARLMREQAQRTTLVGALTLARTTSAEVCG
jgi:hypothetical protein